MVTVDAQTVKGGRYLTRLAARKGLALDVKALLAGARGFTPIWPLYKIEHAFAQLGRWRRLSAATRVARQVPAPGSKSPRSATSPGAWSPDAVRRIPRRTMAAERRRR